MSLMRIGFGAIVLVDEPAGEATDSGPDAAEVRAEGFDSQRARVVDRLVIGHPRFRRFEGAEPKVAYRGDQMVIVWSPVGEVSRTEPVSLLTVSVEDDGGGPSDPAALVRVPQIERFEDADAVRVAVDRERQEPARRVGGVAPG